jgi:type III secretion protein L
LFSTVVELDQAYLHAQRQRDAMLATAHEQAAAITAQAECEATALREAARLSFESAQADGYQAGREEALADWYRRSAEASKDRRAIQTMLRDRLAELVVVAVEQIVRSEDSSTLFARSACEIDRIADGCAYLSVRVHPDDYAAATREFDRFALEWSERGRAIPLTVVADRKMTPGDCICESDLGIVDASLSIQLAAMRNAVARALRVDSGSLLDYVDAFAGAPSGAPGADEMPDSVVAGYVAQEELEAEAMS